MRYRAFAAGVLLVLFALVGCGTGSTSAGSDAAPGGSSTVSALTFTGTTLDGQQYDAATLAGKPALLWFWAPWCTTCAAEAPDVIAAQERYGDQLGIVGIAGLDDLPNMQPFVDRTGTGAITHLGDPKGEIWRQFKITQQSTYVLLDPAGKVTSSGVYSSADLAAKLAALVG